MSFNIPTWISGLDRARDCRPQWADIERLFKRGDGDTLVEIARECAHFEPQGWARRSVLDRIVELLALTPGLDNIKTLCRVFEALPLQGQPQQWLSSRQSRARRLASMLAQEQAPRDLLWLGSWAGDDQARRELVACCAQELVVRGRAIEDELNAHPVTRAILQAHPLGAVPLRLLETERGFPRVLPRYSKGSRSNSLGSANDSTPVGQGQTRQVRPIEANQERLQSAAANWSLESNGRLDCGAFSIEPPVEAEEFGARLLRESGLDSTRDVQVARRVPLASALQILFGAACNGGAYNAGECGAWGRLLTWRSVGALAGCNPAAPVETVNEEARHCAWFDFAGEGAWFHNVAWDLGLACLRPDGTSMAVLAATDTD